MAIALNSPSWFALRRKLELDTQKLLTDRKLTGWKVIFEHSISRAGRCRHDEKTISYGVPFLLYASDAERANTVLHEVAHAITGAGHGHELTWKNNFLKLGGNGSVSSHYPDSIYTEANFTWLGTCPTCKDRTGMNNAPETVWGCAKCPKTVAVENRVYSWAFNGVAVAPHSVSPEYSSNFTKLAKEF